MDFRRLFDLFAYQQVRFPQEVALAKREAMGWLTYSTDECIALTDGVSAGMLALGLEPGDKVAIVSSAGSPRWNFLDLGLQQIGVVVVPLHAAATRDELVFILKETQAKYCIAGDGKLFDLLDSARPDLPGLKGILSMESLTDRPGWEQILRQPSESQLEQIRSLKSAIREDDLATIIYTSGSTGQPKGIMLSHRNIISNIKSVITLIPVNCYKRAASFLPLSHIFERMVVFTYIAVGTSVYYPGDPATLLEDIRDIRPHYFTAVPRMLEKMHDDILEMSGESPTLKGRIIRWAVRLGKQYRENHPLPLQYRIKHRLADLLVFRHWRKRLGNRVEGVVVGAAALNPELGRLFSAAGIRIREGYGLTETSPVIAFNRFEPGGVQFGTVGIPIPGVEVKIDVPDDDGNGEILVKGPNVMLGYFNPASGSGKHLDADGWFHTGDIGKMVRKHFLQITGRKHDIFKTSPGKFIAPEALENKLRNSPFIEQCLVAGPNRPFPTALIVPCFPILKRWCVENEVHWTAPQFMVLNPKIVQLLNDEINKINEALPSYQKIRNFHLLHQAWSVESGELTPTLKYRRDVILEKFGTEVDRLYES